MIIVTCILLLLGFFAGIRCNDDDMALCCFGFFVFAAIGGLVLLGFIINGRTLDKKIELYQTENAAIEESIDSLVEQYMKYESDTYGQLKGESSITLVSLYPELKADELVSQQCELYVSNNRKIIELQEQKIAISNYKFWLYFGK